MENSSYDEQKTPSIQLSGDKGELRFMYLDTHNYYGTKLNLWKIENKYENDDDFT